MWAQVKGGPGVEGAPRDPRDAGNAFVQVLSGREPGHPALCAVDRAMGHRAEPPGRTRCDRDRGHGSWEEPSEQVKSAGKVSWER